MKLITYREGAGTRAGFLAGGGRVHPLAACSVAEIIVTSSLAGTAQLEPVGPAVYLDDVKLLAPIPRPARNVFCVGKNYREHAQEFEASGYDRSSSGAEESDALIVFTKPPSSVIGDGAEIDRHRAVTNELDYEAELAVIIGRSGRDILPEDAPQYIWGYTIVNDVTARDRQRDHKQWFLGKGLDTFCPMGPWAVTADEVDPSGQGRPDLVVTCWVNGEIRQEASTRDLIFDIPTIIAEISSGLTLEPCDIIATGTPAGVGIGFTPPRFLDIGDEVAISITGLGTLSNWVADLTPLSPHRALAPQRKDPPYEQQHRPLR